MSSESIEQSSPDGENSTPSGENRRDVLIAAGLNVLGATGWHGLTHRAVEQLAGVPHGSVVYYFGSRDGLVEALADDVCAADVAEWTAATAQLASVLAGRDTTTQAIVDLLVDRLLADRVRLVARYELFLEGARRPELARSLAKRGKAIRHFLEPIATALGSSRSERDAELLARLLDGLLLGAVIGAVDDEPEALRNDLREAVDRTFRVIESS
ncbi:MAG: TetR family transcriptional regulator [Nitriliruptoraceae bacterium]|nr:TetR family transcriptional regulator [Nitriliruptoraceae bacterium]